MDILTYIQGQSRRSLNVIIALLEITMEKQKKQEDTAISWNEVKTRFKQQKPIATSTLYHLYRQCRDDLVELGLAILVPCAHSRDSRASDIKLTAQGSKIAVIIAEFTNQLTKEMENNTTVKTV